MNEVKLVSFPPATKEELREYKFIVDCYTIDNKSFLFTAEKDEVALCFSCDKNPQKYATGLCESCHQQAMKG